MKAVVADINANGGVAGRQIELVSHVLSGADAILNPDLGRQACVQATEDDKPFAVIIAAAMPAPIVQCVAAGPRRADDHDGQLARRASTTRRRAGCSRSGRTSRSSVTAHVSRVAAASSTTPGCWRARRSASSARTSPSRPEDDRRRSLKPAIEDLGYEVAAEAVLPCPEGRRPASSTRSRSNACRTRASTSCSSSRRRSPVSATVEAAKNLGYKPQWATVGNNVTNTVAKFYTNAKDDYDGAYGLAIAFTDWTDDGRRVQPHRGRRRRRGVPAGLRRLRLHRRDVPADAVLAQAIDAVDGTIDQATVIAALEAARRRCR